MEDLPYKAEYAKSGRASCKGCKSPIPQASLRLAIMVQSHMFDGRTPNWFHFDCFFNKQRPKALGDFDGALNLRYEDQEKLRKKIEEALASGAVVASGKGGKKRGAAAASASTNKALKDFKLEYAKSSRATCRGCELLIMKGEVRVSKKDYETEVGMKYGGQDMWHHLDCFAKVRNDLLYFAAGSMLPGYLTLSKDDKKLVDDKIPAIKEADLPPEAKKIKVEKKEEKDPEEVAYEKQCKELYKIRDKLKKNLAKKELVEILEENEQYVPEGTDRILDQLADIFCFGAIAPCTSCDGGLFTFNNNQYECTGNLSEWTKCPVKTKSPKRIPINISPELKDSCPKPRKPQNRILKELARTIKIKKEEGDETDGPKVQREKPPLYQMSFVIERAKSKDLDKKIIKLGGKIGTKIDANTMALITTKERLDKDWSSKVLKAQELNVHVIHEDFLEMVAKGKDYAEAIKNCSLCSWGSDPSLRIKEYKSEGKSKSMYKKKSSGPVKMKIKGGGAVDPDSELEDVAHVFEDADKVKYTSVLGLTDIQKNQNKYYKIQLLKADKGNSYWVFRSWGRIGTTVGGTKLEKFSSLNEAKTLFHQLFLEKSGNEWRHKDSFQKMPGLMYPIDVDYNLDDEAEAKGLSSSDINSDSKLHKSVQSLVKMLFDVATMKKAMAEFEIDMEKMPLGKLSKKQIQQAFAVLSELQKLAETAQSGDVRFVDACNRFYTLIPHDFGTDNPPLITTKEQIQSKLEMLDNLLEIEIAYSMMKASSGSDSSVTPIDAHYAQLNTNIEPLDKNSDEFKLIEKYVRNTHAETHKQYELKIQDVFKVDRKGEQKRYKPFKKLPNRKLLWHGSRVTNFAGILSQGLRIAPPEAPVTGYMFGKGIYFADMVSKSANYCSTTKTDPVGLLLLCEVALGKMLEKKQADYIEKLPKGVHSVKGLGRTEPDPKECVKGEGDVEIPCGKGIKHVAADDSSLLYNEYIVYDVAQVNCKYLLKVEFDYKY